MHEHSPSSTVFVTVTVLAGQMLPSEVLVVVGIGMVLVAENETLLLIRVLVLIEGVEVAGRVKEDKGGKVITEVERGVDVEMDD